MSNFRMGLAVAGILTFFLVAGLSPVALSQDQDPEWAEKNNYAEYDLDGELFFENQSSGVENRYVFSGTYRVEVKSVWPEEGHATVNVEVDRTWENGKKPPGGSEEESQEQEWGFEESSLFYIDEPTFEEIKTGNIPSKLENSYQGETTVSSPFGELETYRLKRTDNRSMGTGQMTLDEDYHYSVDIGLVVKASQQRETRSGSFVSSFSNNLILKDTNMFEGDGKEFGETFWPWVAAGAVVLAIAGAVFAVKVKK